MACRDPQRPDDQTAKQLVQLCLPEVEVCLHDDGSEPMMYDLDLRWPDGRVEAVEVTRATSAPMRQLLRRIALRGRLDAVQSTRSWVVPLATYDTDVAAVRARIDHLLGLVEQAGITEFGESTAEQTAGKCCCSTRGPHDYMQDLLDRVVDVLVDGSPA